MTQPTWITPAGTLGTIAENRHISYALEAVDATAFAVITGALPAGLTLTNGGIITGVPRAQFESLPVGATVTSRFTVRASGADSSVADRTFALTIAGQDLPVWVTPAGSLGEILDCSEFAFQLEATDQDSEPLVFSLAGGALPPGLSLLPSGVITGIIEPLLPQETTTELSREFAFAVLATDGKDTALREFSLWVWARSELPTDTSGLLNPASDRVNYRRPFVLTPDGSLGIFRNDNYFAWPLTTRDFNAVPTQLVVVGGALPPGLTLDPSTGWISGVIPALGLVEQEFTFTVRASAKNNPAITSARDYTFSITLRGNIENEVDWHIDAGLGGELEASGTIMLGVIYAGTDSLLYVLANTRTQIPLSYTLDAGSVPPGMALLLNGLVAGRPVFNYHDLGTPVSDTTARRFEFVVRASSANGLVSVTQRFAVVVDQLATEPWENIYVKAMPPRDDRDLIDWLRFNSDIIPDEAVYRKNDLRFGVAKYVSYVHAYGVSVATAEEYIEMMNRAHYRKLLTVGEIRTAQALDQLGNVVYEVVYATIVDDIEGVNERVRLDPAPVVDGVAITGAYPNSIENMRRQVFRELGQQVAPLPLWMTSKQTTGRILGYTPAWVIAYVKPGTAKKIAYSVAQRVQRPLNQIDFDVERYIIDRELTFNWGPECETIYVDTETPPITDCDPVVDSFVPTPIYPVNVTLEF